MVRFNLNCVSFVIAFFLAVSFVVLPDAAIAKSIYGRFLFFPTKTVAHRPDALNGVACEDVSIPIGKQSMKGWFFHRADSPYVVLINHGNGGNMGHMVRIADYVTSAGVSALVYDYRGYGESEGSPSSKSICADGDAAYAFVREKGYSPEQIILYGQSLGCAVTCHIAQNHQVGAIILQSGFSSLRAVASETYPKLRHMVPIVVPDVLDNVKALKKINAPVLIIHGDQDSVVPVHMATMLYDAASGPKRIVICKGGGHNLRETADELKENVRVFVADYIANKFEAVPKTLAIEEPAQTVERKTEKD